MSKFDVKYLLTIIVLVASAFLIGLMFRNEMMSIVGGAFFAIGMITSLLLYNKYRTKKGLPINPDFTERSRFEKAKVICKILVQMIGIIVGVMALVGVLSLVFQLNVSDNIELSKPIVMLVAGAYFGVAMQKYGFWKMA